jgi:hypothetical protein
MLTEKQEERMRNRRARQHGRRSLQKPHIKTGQQIRQRENRRKQWRNQSAKHYVTHKETHNDRFKAKRKAIKLEAIEYKGNRCSICGYDRCSAALEFHHMDPSKKDSGIADLMNKCNFELLRPELDKCILLCSNCHRETHANQ